MRQSKKPSAPKRLNSKSIQDYLPWALVLVLGVFFMAYGFRTSSASIDLAKVNQPQQIILSIEVPTKAVAAGELLESVTYSQVKWPVSGDVGNYVQKATDYKGYYAKVPLAPFSPILSHQISASFADVNAVVEAIPEGYRAITVKVDVESVVEGWAQAGSFVDVILIRRSQDGQLGMEAKVIAENVKILAGGASVETSAKAAQSVTAPQTVTLLVTQEDALKIRTAATIGKLTFALRGMGDQTPSAAVAMNQRILLGGNRIISKNVSYQHKGMARGPDGKVYVLEGNSKWILDELGSAGNESGLDNIRGGDIGNTPKSTSESAMNKGMVSE